MASRASKPGPSSGRPAAASAGGGGSAPPAGGAAAPSEQAAARARGLEDEAAVTGSSTFPKNKENLQVRCALRRASASRLPTPPRRTSSTPSHTPPPLTLRRPLPFNALP